MSATHPMSATPDPALDVRVHVADARLQQLRSLTPLPEGPPVLPSLAGADQLGFALAPMGHTLGVTARGSGPDFTESLATLVGQLLDPRAAEHVRIIGAQTDHRALEAEVAVGTAGWLRVGALDVNRTQAQAILEQMAVSLPEQARLLYEDGTTVTGVAVFSDGVHPTGAAVTHTRSNPSGAVVFVEHQSELTRERHAGKADRALIDWMVEQSIATNDSLPRMGKAHSILETKGPHTMVWQSADPSGTVVFLYDSPAASPAP